MHKQVTFIVFWVAFISLLATTIPHVAWVFYQYETGETTMLNLWFTSIDVWWLISFGVAIGIDALIAWLSFVKVLGKSRADNNLVWLFIGLLCVLSWYCNYLYAMAHNPVQKIDIWNISLLGGLTTTGSITPVIISAIPLFVIAYTFMLSKLADSKERTSTDLAAIANELEAVNIQKARIKAAKRKSTVEDINGVWDSVKEISTHIKGDVTDTSSHTHTNQDETTDTNIEAMPLYTVVANTQEKDTGPIASLNGHKGTQVLSMKDTGINGIPVYSGIMAKKRQGLTSTLV